MRLAPVAVVCVLSACTGIHPHRVSPKELAKLTRTGDRFVLVFGSVQTLPGSGAAIRFMHEDQAVASVLSDIQITSGDRFYAVLRAPGPGTWLDHFDAEVRWADATYEKVTYLKLAERKKPIAVYIGEIDISAAFTRVRSVTVRDDFETAARELKRLYPKFTGEVKRSPLLRRSPPAPAPARAR